MVYAYIRQIPATCRVASTSVQYFKLVHTVTSTRCDLLVLSSSSSSSSSSSKSLVLVLVAERAPDVPRKPRPPTSHDGAVLYNMLQGFCILTARRLSDRSRAESSIWRAFGSPRGVCEAAVLKQYLDIAFLHFVKISKMANLRWLVRGSY
jgi:hypothetical protein